MEPITNDKPYYRAGMTLDCGARIDITQQNNAGNVDLVVAPPTGIPISDTADFKDGNLHVRLTEKSFAEFYLLLYSVCGPVPEPKKFSLFRHLKDVAFFSLLWYALWYLTDAILRHYKI